MIVARVCMAAARAREMGRASAGLLLLPLLLLDCLDLTASRERAHAHAWSKRKAMVGRRRWEAGVFCSCTGSGCCTPFFTPPPPPLVLSLPNDVRGALAQPGAQKHTAGCASHRCSARPREGPSSVAPHRAEIQRGPTRPSPPPNPIVVAAGLAAQTLPAADRLFCALGSRLTKTPTKTAPLPRPDTESYSPTLPGARLPPLSCVCVALLPLLTHTHTHAAVTFQPPPPQPPPRPRTPALQ